MKRLYLTALLLCCTLSFGCYAAMQRRPEAVNDTAVWEYGSVNTPTLEQVNHLGAQGWELVTIVRDDDVKRSMWVFKRPKR